MDMRKDLFADSDFGKKAIVKLAPVDHNFRLYRAGWVERRPPFKIFTVTGAIFREAKSGPNKGQLCIKVKGTDRTVRV